MCLNQLSKPTLGCKGGIRCGIRYVPTLTGMPSLRILPWGLWVVCHIWLQGNSFADQLLGPGRFRNSTKWLHLFRTCNCTILYYIYCIIVITYICRFCPCLCLCRPFSRQCSWFCFWGIGCCQVHVLSLWANENAIKPEEKPQTAATKSRSAFDSSVNQSKLSDQSLI